MDLLREVLVRLPLQRALDIGIDQLIKGRTLSVNHLNREDLLNANSPLGERDNYVKLCTYQGELCKESHLYMWPNYLMKRALEIGDYQSYLHFSDYFVFPVLSSDEHKSIHDPWFLQSALETGVPEVMAKALSIVEQSQFEEDHFMIIDPPSINWTPKLTAYYTNRCRQYENRILGHPIHAFIDSTAFLAGYLQIWPLEDVVKLPLTGHRVKYLAGYVHRDPTNLRILSHLLSLFGKPGLQTYLETIVLRGYIPPDFLITGPDILIYALKGVQPDTVARIFRHIPADWNHQLTVTDFTGIIYPSKSTIHRAQKMLELFAEDPLMLERLGIPHSYVAYLYALCGIPLTSDDFSHIDEEVRSVETSVGNTRPRGVEDAMFSVCHPSLTEEIIRRCESANSLGPARSSPIHYDPINFFLRITNYSPLFNGEHIGLMVKYGIILRSLKNPAISSLIARMQAAAAEVEEQAVFLNERIMPSPGPPVVLLTPELVEQYRRAGKPMPANVAVPVQNPDILEQLKRMSFVIWPELTFRAETNRRRYGEILSELL